jgi:hypothetical protein
MSGGWHGGCGRPQSAMQGRDRTLTGQRHESFCPNMWPRIVSAGVTAALPRCTDARTSASPLQSACPSPVHISIVSEITTDLLAVDRTLLAAMSSSDDDIVPNVEAEPQTWDDWTEDEDDDGCDPIKSLFSDAVLPSAEAAMDHDAKHFGFDLRTYKQQVNSTRKRTRSGQ